HVSALPGRSRGAENLFDIHDFDLFAELLSVDPADVVDGTALCRMFKQAIRGASLPKYLSSDHDPLYRFHQWRANLRILGVTEIKTVPYIPWSHRFIERLIGTIRRECLDQLLFWTATDLETKLIAFRDYYNRHRIHAGLKGETPIETLESKGANLKSYR